jgi:hypothetical protein
MWSYNDLCAFLKRKSAYGYQIEPSLRKETMETISQPVLADIVKAVAATVLSQLQAHNSKTAALLSTTFTATEDILEHSSQIFALVKTLAPLLGEIFEAVKSWLQTAYAHLVDLFVWVKDFWNSIFGHHTKAAIAQ